VVPAGLVASSLSQRHRLAQILPVR
jgi:hypothetical protein